MAGPKKYLKTNEKPGNITKHFKKLSEISTRSFKKPKPYTKIIKIEDGTSVLDAKTAKIWRSKKQKKDVPKKSKASSKNDAVLQACAPWGALVSVPRSLHGHISAGYLVAGSGL